MSQCRMLAGGELNTGPHEVDCLGVMWCAQVGMVEVGRERMMVRTASWWKAERKRGRVERGSWAFIEMWVARAEAKRGTFT